MNLIFWQNIISPHQLPFIKQLASFNIVNKVVLIVEKPLTPERVEMGWIIQYENSKSFQVIINPDDLQIQTIFDIYTTDTYHFFSGIKAYPMVYKAFKTSLNYNTKRGLIAETPFFYKKPPWLHAIKTIVFNYRDFKYVEFVFSMGERGVNWYKIWNHHWKVFEFAYCVNNNHFSVPETTKAVNFVFMGSLTNRKNPKLLLQTLQSINCNFIMNFIGDGILKNKLKKMVSDSQTNSKFIFHGNKNRNEALCLMQKQDVLILPSKFDGWGAVVNEALMAGLFVIVSDKCGSKCLIDKNNKRGIIFKSGSRKNLEKVINYTIQNIDNIRNSRNKRIEWSSCISGLSIAKYFVRCLIANDTVIPPWRK